MASPIIWNFPTIPRSTVDLRNSQGFVGRTDLSPPSADTILLNSRSSGVYNTGAGDDVIDYNSGIGARNTIINGGSGNDTLSFSKFTASQVLRLLKGRGYSVELNPGGLTLLPPNGQRVRLQSIENIRFKDASFNLGDPVQQSAFLKALRGANIPIIDQSSQALNPLPAQPANPLVQILQTLIQLLSGLLSPNGGGTTNLPTVQPIPTQFANQFGGGLKDGIFNGIVANAIQQAFAGPNGGGGDFGFPDDPLLNNPLSFVPSSAANALPTSTVDLRGVQNFSGSSQLNVPANNTIVLSQDSSGFYFAGDGDDTFDYEGSLGRFNTVLNAGNGFDTFALSNLTAADAANELAQQGYAIVLRPNGFSLISPNGQVVRVNDIEEIAFSDSRINLTDPNQANTFVQLLENSGVPIVDGADFEGFSTV